MRTFPAVIALWGLTLLGPWPRAAWGHALPNHAEPRVGATVAVSPTHVRIRFDDALKPALCTLRVQNGSGQQVDQRDGHVDPSDTRLLEVSLPSLPPGTYRVIWNVVGRDGHRSEGNYTFTIR